MSDESPQTPEQKKLAKRRLLVRIGMITFGLMALYLSVPMLIGAFGGYARGEARDPYTNRLVSEQARDERHCQEEARELLLEAGDLDEIHRRWDERFRGWNARCREGHPGLYQLLIDTRTELRHGRESEKS